MNNQLAIKEYFHQDIVSQSFREILGNRQGDVYIQSVLLAVASSEQLQNCTPMSIMTSALRAATLQLSVDPSTGQAYLVPFKGRAILVIGYRGLHHMAIRTGKYRYLNVSKIYEGEEIIEDRLTGMVSLGGGKKSNTVVGWLMYFELVAGYRKMLYMSCEDIHEHAKRYSQSYQFASSAWKTNTADMERKTVLRQGLMKWGYFDAQDREVLDQIETDDVIEAAAVETFSETKELTAETVTPPTSKSATVEKPAKVAEPAKVAKTMPDWEKYAHVKTPKGTGFGTLTAEQLKAVLEKASTEELKTAAAYFLQPATADLWQEYFAVADKLSKAGVEIGEMSETASAREVYQQLEFDRRKLDELNQGVPAEFR